MNLLLFGIIGIVAGFIFFYFKAKKENDEFFRELAKIADTWIFKDIPDAETGTIVKYLLYRRKPNISSEDAHKIKRDLCELPGLGDYVLMEDYQGEIK